MSEPLKINLVHIPGSRFVALADDKNLTPKAIERGTIVIEDQIAALPEVQALDSNDVVYDVGAFIGDTALIFARQGATVYAFEPQPDAYYCCRSNVQEHGGQVSCFRWAIGNGEYVFNNNDPINGNLGTRTVARAPIGKGGQCAYKLDSIVKAPTFKPPTFIKIDVEGYEPAVVLGALETLRIYKPTLLIEIYPELLRRQGWTPDDITKPLLKLGYKIHEAIGNSSEPRWDIICMR